MCLRWMILMVVYTIVSGLSAVDKVNKNTENSENRSKAFPETIHAIDSWKCPSVTNVKGISCTCDIPHTVRCRGHASKSRIIIDLVNQLKITQDKTSQISLLDLAIHDIHRLPPITFNGLSLLGLVISKANLITLSNDSLLGLENSLLALGLPANDLQAVPKEALRYLRNMQRLDLSGNHLKILKSLAFPPLLQLQSLNIAGNEIRVIEPEAFVRLSQLKTLILANNLLNASQINEKRLRGLELLSELSLKSNLIKGPLSSAFLQENSLTSLDLSHNLITSISLGALKGCKNLQFLDLSYNNIDIIEDHAFRHLSSLKTLTLAHNQIISVSGWSLAHLPLLVTLGLADNALFAVTADLLHQLPSLQSLDLAANDISLLQPDVFNYTPSLQNINLADNPLHCDCSLKWLWRWLNNHHYLSDENQHSIVCTTPPAIENAPLIDLNITELVCLKEIPDYYHEAEYGELYDLPIGLPDADVSLKDASKIGDVVQLIWSIDQRAVPYTCQAVHIYEIERTGDSTHQILAEKIDVNCSSSQDQSSPHQVIVTIPETLLRPGKIYRYCLVLLENGMGDEDKFLPGCSQAIPLKNYSNPIKDPFEEFQDKPENEVVSLTAGNMGMSLVVQTKMSNYGFPCSYTVYVFHHSALIAAHELNCSEVRQTLRGLSSGKYMVCVRPNNSKEIIDLEEKLRYSQNITAMLLLLFPACTSVQLQEEPKSTWNSAPFLTLLFTLPGLAFIITLYLIGQRVWKGGGVPWRWDPEVSKRTKYFLYTSEATTPTVSLESLESPVPESSL